LPNHYQLNRRLVQLCPLAEHAQPFCVLFVDLDNSKEINDGYGHRFGDELLIQLADRLGGVNRGADFLARIGGGEFVVVMHDVSDPYEAEMFAVNIQYTVAKPFVVEEHELSVTVIIGLAFYPQDGEDATCLLQHADQAMYTAKDAGRDSIYFFNFELRDQADSQIEIHQSLVSGLKNKQFSLHCQPIIDLNTGQFIKCEALLRWQHPGKV
jgi:diguanylate cyclase (GGDEF)-like protein